MMAHPLSKPWIDQYTYALNCDRQIEQDRFSMYSWCVNPAVQTCRLCLVEKWIKQNKMDFLGIPSCVGFGPHADSYRCGGNIYLHIIWKYLCINLSFGFTSFFFLCHRFLIFPNMGQSLQSVIEEEEDHLSEKTVLQLACRLVSVHTPSINSYCPTADLLFNPNPLFNVPVLFQLDVLQYIHSNEYVHADINADNVYIKPGQTSQVRHVLSLQSVSMMEMCFTLTTCFLCVCVCLGLSCRILPRFQVLSRRPTCGVPRGQQDATWGHCRVHQPGCTQRRRCVSSALHWLLVQASTASSQRQGNRRSFTTK